MRCICYTLFVLAMGAFVSCGHDAPTTPTKANAPAVPGGKREIGPALSWYQSQGDLGTNAPTQGCYPRAGYGDELVWRVTVLDAGEAPFVRFKTYSFHDDAPGCDETSANLRTERVRLFSGPEVYRPHETGTTYFAWPANEFTCGRSKVVIDLDAAGAEANLVHITLDYGVPCS